MMKTGKFIIWLCMLMAGSSLKAQVPPIMTNWDQEVIAKANTAVETDYLTDDEKMVILYINMARVNGPLFSETFLAEYIRVKKLKSSRYISSLYSDLQNAVDLPMLIPERDLYDITLIE